MIGRNSHVRLHSGEEVGLVRYLNPALTHAMVDWPRSPYGWHDLCDLVQVAIIADAGMGPDGR